MHYPKQISYYTIFGWLVYTVYMYTIKVWESENSEIAINTIESTNIMLI